LDGRLRELERAVERKEPGAELALWAELYRLGRLEPRGIPGLFRRPDLPRRAPLTYDAERQRLVTLHRLGLSPEALARWRASVERLATLDAPEITGPEVAGPTDGRRFVCFVLEQGPPGPAWEELERGWQSRPLDQRLGWVRATGRAVALVHELGAVFGGLHRMSLEPQLHLVRFLPPEDQPDLEADGATLGFPFFMHPERFQGRRGSIQGDVEMLGLLLYLALTGRHPGSPLAGEAFDARTLFKNMAARTFPSPRARDPEIDPRLERVCLRALRCEGSGEPYADAAAFLADLERAEADQPLSDAGLLERLGAWWRGGA
jgi:hypothetical protein